MTEYIVQGVGVWTPGFPDAEAWLAGEADPEVTRAEASALGKRNRRRASPLTRALADAFGQSIAQAEMQGPEVATVFGSALGEATTMIKLLDQMWREEAEGDLSPMAFATSVHNAASGLVSIATKNRGFTTSLAADYDTPAMALFEAAGLLATGDAPVVVVVGDEAAPKDLVPAAETFDMLTAAVALVPAAAPLSGLARLRGPFRGEATLEGADLRPELARNPQAGILDLADTVLRRREGTLRLDRGRGDGWCVEVTPL